MSVTRNQYLAALTAACNKIVRDPQEVKALCPHLNSQQIKKLERRPAVHIALPPVLLRSSYKIACFSYGSLRLTAVHKRTPGTYADSKQYTGLTDNETSYRQEAMAFAAANWSSSLHQANWSDIARIVFYDPTHLRRGIPQYVATVSAALNRTVLAIEEDQSLPRTQLVDNAIVTATAHPLEGLELEGDVRSVVIFSACARCGGSLGPKMCHGCGRQYESVRYTGWDTMPLPPKVTQLLWARGYKFEHASPA